MLVDIGEVEEVEEVEGVEEGRLGVLEYCGAGALPAGLRYTELFLIIQRQEGLALEGALPLALRFAGEGHDENAGEAQGHEEGDGDDVHAGR